MISCRNLIVYLVFIFLLFLGVPIRIKPKHEAEFELFLERYNKSYANETVYKKRLQAFEKSLAMIEKLNANRTSNNSALYGVTQYSDMFEDEFREQKLLLNYPARLKKWNTTYSSSLSKRRRSPKTLPTKIDWREFGVITPINNQGSCGACWAFSSIEIIESMNALNTKKLQKLSTQELIDCAGYNNAGCKGGDSCSLLAWLKDYAFPVQTEEEYPLHYLTETCKTNETMNGVRVVKYGCNSFVGNENLLLKKIAFHGPVAVAINALMWQNYLDGVIQYHCNSHPLLLNHAVQIVGYNLEPPIPHYIVRNSWGEEFGDNGYLYIAIGKNLCGLANEVSYVDVLYI